MKNLFSSRSSKLLLSLCIATCTISGTAFAGSKVLDLDTTFITESAPVRFLSSLFVNGNLLVGTETPLARLTVAGSGSFTDVVSGVTPIAPNHLTTKQYVDATVLAAGWVTASNRDGNLLPVYPSKITAPSTFLTTLGKAYINNSYGIAVPLRDGGIYSDQQGDCLLQTDGKIACLTLTANATNYPFPRTLNYVAGGGITFTKFTKTTGITFSYYNSTFGVYQNIVYANSAISSSWDYYYWDPALPSSIITPIIFWSGFNDRVFSFNNNDTYCGIKSNGQFWCQGTSETLAYGWSTSSSGSFFLWANNRVFLPGSLTFDTTYRTTFCAIQASDKQLYCWWVWHANFLWSGYYGQNLSTPILNPLWSARKLKSFDLETLCGITDISDSTGADKLYCSTSSAGNGTTATQRLIGSTVIATATDYSYYLQYNATNYPMRGICALTSLWEIYCAGVNTFSAGQNTLYNGRANGEGIFTLINSGTPLVAFVSGNCARDSVGNNYCWRVNPFKPAGNNITSFPTTGIMSDYIDFLGYLTPIKNYTHSSYSYIQ